MQVTTPDERRGGPGRFLALVLIVIVIVLTTVFFAVRTEGGSDFIRQRVEQHLGLALTVERMRIGWPYALVMEKVATTAFDTGAAGLAVQEIRVAPSWHHGWQVTARRARIRLARNDDGVWGPPYFRPVGEAAFADLTDIGRLGEALGERRPFSLTASSIEWCGAGSTNVAAVYGVEYTRTPLRVPGHRMAHHRLAVGNRVGPGARRASDLLYEWLSSETLPYVPLVEPATLGVQP